MLSGTGRGIVLELFGGFTLGLEEYCLGLFSQLSVISICSTSDEFRLSVSGNGTFSALEDDEGILTIVTASSEEHSGIKFTEVWKMSPDCDRGQEETEGGWLSTL